MAGYPVAALALRRQNVDFSLLYLFSCIGFVPLCLFNDMARDTKRSDYPDDLALIRRVFLHDPATNLLMCLHCSVSEN